MSNHSSHTQKATDAMMTGMFALSLVFFVLPLFAGTVVVAYEFCIGNTGFLAHALSHTFLKDSVSWVVLYGTLCLVTCAYWGQEIFKAHLESLPG
ncbi:hypothetical protein KTD31_02910 [Burkholderia multivorans]|uniref:hypothetical protein n=1 Tax=Burkholderia multivorans TaxID=87883 RepID=UPI001C21C715|nr:hypothetical protein [Burkholderia multivorans]MBU9200302.1 hypothetical protein [Burkholderia multivorans]MDN8078572.1 hypothetical protein [Burkholderia multivorans]